MRKLDTERLIEEFIKNAEANGEAAYSGKYKAVNRTHDRLKEIERIMIKNPTIAKEMIDALVNHSNINVKIWVSGIALTLGYRSGDAIKLLKQISTLSGAGILSLEAKMILKVRGILE